MSDAGETDGGPRRYVGAVRCPAGWFAVAYDPGEEGYVGAGVHAEIGRLWSHYEDSAERIAVDVPIGLVPDERPPDRLAAALLDREIEPPPVREATRRSGYRAARRVQRRVADRDLAPDAIAEVDALVCARDAARAAFLETRPAVCYLAFAGEAPAHPRERAAGYAERLRTLVDVDPDAVRTVQRAAEAAGDGDLGVAHVLDAVALGLTVRPGPGRLRSLPPELPTDGEGLPMRTVYRSSTPLSPSPEQRDTGGADPCHRRDPTGNGKSKEGTDRATGRRTPRRPPRWTAPPRCAVAPPLPPRGSPRPAGAPRRRPPRGGPRRRGGGAPGGGSGRRRR